MATPKEYDTEIKDMKTMRQWHNELLKKGQLLDKLLDNANEMVNYFKSELRKSELKNESLKAQNELLERQLKLLSSKMTSIILLSILPNDTSGGK